MTDKQKKIAMVGIMLTLILAILDQNIVSTASLSIAADLDPVHGLTLMPWLITVYALAATAALPLYGKLCDVYGAKRVYLAAVGLFLFGSALCGVAQDLPQLIACRTVQGLGGGGLMAVTLVVAAQLMPAERRGSAGGVGGLMAGLGMVAGPLIGGLFTDHLGWRWIFYVNLPVGLFVLVSGALAIKLEDGGQARRIDYLGAALAAAGASVLLLVVEWGGKTYAWDSATILAMIALDVALVAGFVWRQATAAEPILPPELLRNAVVRVVLPLQVLTGLGMAGSIFYTIVYLQTVMAVHPTDSGLYLIPMAAGMVVSGTVSGMMINRGSRAKPFLLSGFAFIAVSLFLLGLMGTAGSVLTIGFDLLVLGLGFGQVLGIAILMAQNAVPLSALGTATTAVRFAQTLGMALGTAIFGVVLNRVVGADRGVEAFAGGTHAVFWTAAAVMLATLLLGTLLREERQSAPVS
ncbi:MFS transporter [Nonomuraea sp. NPDC050556]|uniref:MFS transporter n=1 Tax=Nonomuraea sp. NPDC050556 TaxID=3364369 RepID=UPI0037B94439